MTILITEKNMRNNNKKQIGVTLKVMPNIYIFLYKRRKEGQISSTDNIFQTNYIVQMNQLWNVSSAKVEFGTNSYGNREKSINTRKITHVFTAKTYITRQTKYSQYTLY